MPSSIEDLRQHIAFLQSATRIDPIEKGFSPEEKFFIEMAGGPYLLRVMPAESYDRKRTEFAVIQRLHQDGVRVPEPIEIGRIPSLDVSYYILSYLSGEDALDLLPTYSEATQYQIGVEAGRDLRRIHSISAPASVGPWHTRALDKHQRYVDAYRALGLRLNDDARVLRCVEEGAGAWRDRPNQFLHDDFHVGNLVVNDGAYVGAIDFNRYDWGDPAHDFLKIAFFSRPVSVPFSIGQIHGYFGARSVPASFWSLYASYVAATMIASVVWTARVVPQNMDDTMARANQVLEDHRGFELTTPVWYEV